MTSRHIAWREEFSIGISDVDDQHKKLLGLLNEMNSFDHDRNSHASQANKLVEILDKLSDYAAHHFAQEELLMRKHLPADANAADHIVAHRTYWTIIVTLKNRLLKGDAKVNSELVAYLNRWWVDHILQTDQKMGRELNRRGVV